jgi:hypothetical protein
LDESPDYWLERILPIHEFMSTAQIVKVKKIKLNGIEIKSFTLLPLKNLFLERKHEKIENSANYRNNRAGRSLPGGIPVK